MNCHRKEKFTDFFSRITNPLYWLWWSRGWQFSLFCALMQVPWLCKLHWYSVSGPHTCDWPWVIRCPALAQGGVREEQLNESWWGERSTWKLPKGALLSGLQSSQQGRGQEVTVSRVPTKVMCVCWWIIPSSLSSLPLFLPPPSLFPLSLPPSIYSMN